MQNSKAARAAKTPASILMLTLLLGTLSLMPATKANAQVVDCMGRCEQRLALCVAEGGQFKSSCQDAYESCIEACLGDSYAALLG
jgi:hypothetical protein